MGYRDDYFEDNKPHAGWHKCAHCGKSFRKKDIDIDHIIPQKYGGSDRRYNLQAMCKHDNRSKKASLADTVPDLIRENARRAANGIEKETKNSGCFITTAVCGSLGRPDDCYELSSFRKFRDNWLLAQDDGPKLVEQYYDIAPSIVEKINAQSDSDGIYKSIWNKYLKPCLHFVESNENEKCKRLYIQMVNTLREKFL